MAVFRLLKATRNVVKGDAQSDKLNCIPLMSLTVKEFSSSWICTKDELNPTACYRNTLFDAIEVFISLPFSSS